MKAKALDAGRVAAKVKLTNLDGTSQQNDDDLDEGPILHVGIVVLQQCNITRLIAPDMVLEQQHFMDVSLDCADHRLQMNRFVCQMAIFDEPLWPDTAKYSP